MWVAPGFSVCATLNALRTISGMMRPVLIWAFHLVTGRKVSTTSMCWCDSLCMRSSEAWPVMATTGAPSMLASATPVSRLVAPGPRVDRHTPALPLRRP